MDNCSFSNEYRNFLAEFISRMDMNMEQTIIGSDDKNFSPLMNVNKEVMLNILEHLDYQGFVNLALTCSKWYECAVNTPSSIKPIATFKKLSMNEKNISSDEWRTESEFDNLLVFGPSKLTGKRKCWTTDKPLTSLIKTIECDALVLRYADKSASEEDMQQFFRTAVNYLSENMDRYKINQLKLIYPFYGLNMEVLVDLFKLASNIMVSYEDFTGSLSPPVENLAKAILEYKEFKQILCYVPISHIVGRDVMTQYKDGKRPNFSRFSMLSEHATSVWNYEWMERFWRVIRQIRSPIVGGSVVRLTDTRRVRLLFHNLGEAKLMHIVVIT